MSSLLHLGKCQMVLQRTGERIVVDVFNKKNGVGGNWVAGLQNSQLRGKKTQSTVITYIKMSFKPSGDLQKGSM